MTSYTTNNPLTIRFYVEAVGDANPIELSDFKLFSTSNDQHILYDDESTMVSLTLSTKSNKEIKLVQYKYFYYKKIFSEELVDI